ncbi:hypothetical protein BFP71_03550 [Roseivirga misakiensis]|uniref:Capsule assembly Wzi family protein n=2 Tax=Roseivirga misakiensis TaxID=1563681 RepID=A0A1E5T5X8_9BACT|nr:hypothetical protein BFP71_03550 [Roseivirga misakiensis]
MVKFRLIIILIIGYSSIYAQETVHDSINSVTHSLNIESGVLISAKSELPFWVRGNNSQRFKQGSANSVYQILHYNGNYQPIKNIALKWELESLLNIRERIDGRIIQANLSIESKLIRIRGGYDEEFFGLNDSTLSIGNLVYGNNASPIPKVSISTNGWQRSPLFGNHLSFQAYLAHGWFEQNRFQSGAFLHQKYLYLRVKAFNSRLSIIGGLNHNAQWGGANATNESSQPTGIKNYLRILMGSSGGSDANLSDQNNALGNHLGSYDLRGTHEFRHFFLSSYWQFLWEDKSGLTPFNWRDGLMGASIDFKNNGLINKVVIEIIRTNDQDADKVSDDGLSFLEPDNFLNNNTYQSGWTYLDNVIGNPVFLLIHPDSDDFRSRVKNMVNGLNVSIGGNLKGLSYSITYRKFKNAGTRYESIEPGLDVRSAIIYLSIPTIHGSFGIRGEYDWSNWLGKNFGFQCQYRVDLSSIFRKGN